MKTRNAGRWVVAGVVAGVVAAVGMTMTATPGVGQLILTAGSQDATPVGAERPQPAGGPTTVKVGTGRRTPAPGATPVGADKPTQSKPPVATKPGDGQPASPIPTAKPVPPGGPDSGPDGTTTVGGDIVRFVRTVLPASSASRKSAAAECPSGTRVYGGGAKVVNGLGRVTINTLLPGTVLSTGLDRFVAGAARRPSGGGFGKAHAWSLEVYAVCGKALPGYERVIASNDEKLDARVTARATCPTGKSVIGMGGQVSPIGQASFAEMRTNLAHTSVIVTGADDLSDGPIKFAHGTLATAICANRPAKYHVVQRQTPVVTGNQVLDVPCPDDGSVAVSAGVLVQDPIGHAYVDTAAPALGDRSTLDPRLVRLAAQQSPTFADVALKGFAVCIA